MKVKELIEELKKCDPNAEVWTGAHTLKENIPTYGLVDHVYQGVFEQFWTDLFPTPDDIDKRLYVGRNKNRDGSNDPVVYIGTTFGR